MRNSQESEKHGQNKLGSRVLGGSMPFTKRVQSSGAFCR